MTATAIKLITTTITTGIADELGAADRRQAGPPLLGVPAQAAGLKGALCCCLGRLLVMVFGAFSVFMCSLFMSILLYVLFAMLIISLLILCVLLLISLFVSYFS